MKERPDHRLALLGRVQWHLPDVGSIDARAWGKDGIVIDCVGRHLFCAPTWMYHLQSSQRGS